MPLKTRAKVFAAALGVGVGTAYFMRASVKRTWSAVKFPPRPQDVAPNLSDSAYRDVVASIAAARTQVAKGSQSPEDQALARVPSGTLYIPQLFLYQAPWLSGLASSASALKMPYVTLTEFGIYVVETKIGELVNLQLSEKFSDDELVSRAFESLWTWPGSEPGGDLPIAVKGFRNFRFAAEESIRTVLELMSSVEFPNDYPIALGVVDHDPAPVGEELLIGMNGQIVGFPIVGSHGLTLEFSRINPLQTNVEGGIDWLAVRFVLVGAGGGLSARVPVLLGRVNEKLVYGKHKVILHAYNPARGSQSLTYTIDHTKALTI